MLTVAAGFNKVRRYLYTAISHKYSVFCVLVKPEESVCCHHYTKYLINVPPKYTFFRGFKQVSPNQYITIKHSEST